MTMYQVTSLCSLSDLSWSISSSSSSRTFAEVVALGISMACRRNSTAHATVTRKFPLTPLGCVSLHHSCCASTVNAHNKPQTCLNLDCCYDTLAEVEIRRKRNWTNTHFLLNCLCSNLQPLTYQCNICVQLQICCCSTAHSALLKPLHCLNVPKFITP